MAGHDCGSPETVASFQQKCDANGFYTVSERDEFDTIYGDGVKMADAAQTEPEAVAEENGAESAYTLDKVVMLSRHNIRSPLSGSGSMLGDITPHTWFAWTSNPSELSLRGAILETQMGQYFRLWLEDEGLFPENYRPEDGAVRFYANAKQRTQATARYFSAGLLPVAAGSGVRLCCLRWPSVVLSSMYRLRSPTSPSLPWVVRLVKVPTVR